jgi:hypothetical protein
MDTGILSQIGAFILGGIGAYLANRVKTSAQRKDWWVDVIVLHAMRMAEKYLRMGKKAPTNEELKAMAKELLREYAQRQSELFKDIPDEVLDAKIEKLAAQAKDEFSAIVKKVTQ